MLQTVTLQMLPRPEVLDEGDKCATMTIIREDEVSPGLHRIEDDDSARSPRPRPAPDDDDTVNNLSVPDDDEHRNEYCRCRPLAAL